MNILYTELSIFCTQRFQHIQWTAISNYGVVLSSRRAKLCLCWLIPEEYSIAAVLGRADVSVVFANQSCFLGFNARCVVIIKVHLIWTPVPKHRKWNTGNARVCTQGKYGTFCSFMHFHTSNFRWTKKIECK